MIGCKLEEKRRGRPKMGHELKLKGKKSRVSAYGAETEDYVRVRARRGEATDSHSVAERARRAQIRMRMKLLQSLVPGCDKISGKAHILDEIIKYVQLLQNRVESLAARLASVDLMLYDSKPNPTANAYVQRGMLPSVRDGVLSDSTSLLLTQDQTATPVPQYGSDLLMEDQPEAIKQLVHLLSSAN